MISQPKMYCEYVHPIKDYFIISQRNELTFEWGISFFLSFVLYFFVYENIKVSELKDIASLIVNCLAILIGFSITCLTILASASEKNITDLKISMTERVLDNKKISLYRLLVINFIFLLLLELFNLLFNFIFISVSSLDSFKDYAAIFYGFITVFTFSIFLLNIRNITNFYFILSR
ncbi:hypothetical protein CZ809_00588 [Photobacterium piscicola]|uniref:Uncharacterized protein n=3 Tax=Photobacterium TaxID=657 RepID=A0A2N4UVW3_9GAMM|nr:hypothetical protein CIK00_05075 [Photobacterium carnosum]SKC31110.1 hypothetical protein CZ809_00588 [Photobacterium piscicola]